MSDSRSDAERAVPDEIAADAEVRYPTNVVLGVLDSREQLETAYAALTDGGFLADEIRMSTGAERADVVNANTGRSGLASLAVRIAERLGIEDSEMEFKSLYEQAMRDGRYVVGISAPTEARKNLAADLLREHGAHSVSFHGRFAVEGIVPPRDV